MVLENTRKIIQKDSFKYDEIYFKNGKKFLRINSNKLKYEGYWKPIKIVILDTKLEKAYDLKENFYWVLESKNNKEAKARLDIWYKGVVTYNVKKFRKIYFKLIRCPFY